VAAVVSVRVGLGLAAASAALVLGSVLAGAPLTAYGAASSVLAGFLWGYVLGLRRRRW
jgi:hypothetical protein